MSQLSKVSSDSVAAAVVSSVMINLKFKIIEIFGYAEFLGMHLEEDRDLLYIAEEGLKAPVPEPWKAFSNEQEEIYYTNTITGQVIFDHPLDEVYRKKFQEAKMRQMQGDAAVGS